jgi:Lipoprotein LpqB beta-propeller domain/Sporulation and spore germination
MRSRARRPLLALLAAVAAALAVTGCVSMPSAGPVLSYPVTQETGGQNGQNMQFIAQPPGDGWDPQQIVNGFLLAAAAFGNQSQVAKQYLTPSESKTWNPSWSAYVYQTSPSVGNPVYQAAGPKQGAKNGKSGKAGKAGKQAPKAATVAVNGKIQAIVSSDNGTYAVPSASGSDGSSPLPFELVNTGGQWRISWAPQDLLLTPTQFADDYELRNLYFFDPNYHYLVPDPVYVPLQASASTLTTTLVGYLQKQPADWLAFGASQTAFPASTKVVSATLADNVATVTLTGKISKVQQAQVASQLLWTLVGSGQGSSQVESLQLIVNGKPYYPAGTAANPVQNKSQASYGPATGASAAGASATTASPPFYYLDSAGDVYSRAGVGATGKQTLITKLGAGYQQIAVSKDGKYLAALRHGALFIGPIGGPLVPEPGAGYATLSWDPTDNLWTTTGSNDEIYVFRTGVSPGTRQAKPILVTVTSDYGTPTGQLYNALQIAPDGVRVAMITDADELAFGAIDWSAATGPGLGSVKISLSLSPFYVSNLTSGFKAVTWYGPDNVITLGGPGSTLTEYPVNGGTPTSQMLDQTVESITAIPDEALIAGVYKGQMIEALTLTGAWASIVTGGGSPVKGISPTYPG